MPFNRLPIRLPFMSIFEEVLPQLKVYELAILPFLGVIEVVRRQKQPSGEVFGYGIVRGLIRRLHAE